MWLIAGLGNPGEEYKWTRHNIGFIVIDELSRRSNVPLRHKRGTYIYGKGEIDGISAILLKPLTFMNRSGFAIKSALERFKEIKDILIIHDDLDLNLGVIRIKRGGSSGGHRGLESIIQVIGRTDFVRLRIGIGRSERLSPERYVLSAFTKKEKPIVEGTIEDAISAISIIITRGISYAQNMFHKRIKTLSHST